MSRPPRFLRRLALVSALLLPLSACSGTSSNTTTETTAPATTASAPQTSAQTTDGERTPAGSQTIEITFEGTAYPVQVTCRRTPTPPPRCPWSWTCTDPSPIPRFRPRSPAWQPCRRGRRDRIRRRSSQRRRPPGLPEPASRRRSSPALHRHRRRAHLARHEPGASHGLGHRAGDQRLRAHVGLLLEALT